MATQQMLEGLYNALLDYKNCNGINFFEWVNDNIICDSTTPEEVIQYILQIIHHHHCMIFTLYHFMNAYQYYSVSITNSQSEWLHNKC